MLCIDGDQSSLYKNDMCMKLVANKACMHFYFQYLINSMKNSMWLSVCSEFYVDLSEKISVILVFLVFEV